MGLKELFEREARAHIHRECGLMGCTKVGKQGVQEDEKSRFEEEMVWVGDTGASSHMIKDKDGFEWLKKCDEVVNFGTQGDRECCEALRKWSGRNMTKVKDHQFTQEGSKVELEDVMYIPNLRDNLFSITKEMSKGQK